MENEKTLKESKPLHSFGRIMLVFGGIAAISIVIFILKTMPIRGENEIYLNIIFTGLFVCIILLLAFTLWLYDRRLK